MHETESERNELRGFVVEVGKTLTSHAMRLRSHEDNLKAAFKTTENHRDCLVSLRKDMESLAELVNAQSRLVTALQSVMLKVLDKLGMDPPEQPPIMGAPN